ncbi:hypothetical protein CCB80_09345 [Armatimonadetes bacterium Uphvl-Ar1]|nr:hypothetical protein CCB80_09345 [Armatimonadetes bacterium Uphvl-Ar1]
MKIAPLFWRLGRGKMGDVERGEVRVFETVEAADEAAREALRRMTPEERVALAFAISGWTKDGDSGRISRTYRIIDCSQS